MTAGIDSEYSTHSAQNRYTTTRSTSHFIQKCRPKLAGEESDCDQNSSTHYIVRTALLLTLARPNLFCKQRYVIDFVCIYTAIGVFVLFAVEILQTRLDKLSRRVHKNPAAYPQRNQTSSLAWFKLRTTKIIWVSLSHQSLSKILLIICRRLLHFFSLTSLHPIAFFNFSHVGPIYSFLQEKFRTAQ